MTGKSDQRPKEKCGHINRGNAVVAVKFDAGK